MGKGAFGKVFLVKKRDGAKADQLFAMKVLDKEVITQKGQVAHTKSERDILHEIQHPYIVAMHFAFQVMPTFTMRHLFVDRRKSHQLVLCTGFARNEVAHFYTNIPLLFKFLHRLFRRSASCT